MTHPETADWRIAVKVAHSEGQRLKRLVDDLFARACADEGTVARCQLVDLDDVVLEEAKHINNVAVGAAAVSAARVRGNPCQLSRLVANLLSNAARHARSRVTVSLRVADGQVRLAVDDDGAGIPMADRERVFERFARLQEGRSRDAGGAGVGLALAKAASIAHGWNYQGHEEPARWCKG